jgi:chemotaxis receptor (MCP) glutamine deamidase CheD
VEREKGSLKTMAKPDFGTRQRRSIHIGDVCAHREPTVIRTILGSCIAACLYDPVTQVSGMNHFMLPLARVGSTECARYGVHAMELLINSCMKAGADRRRLQAKVFGGGHVLNTKEMAGNVPEENLRFILNFLKIERIPIVSSDIGGYEARVVYFFTDTGRVLLKRLPARAMPRENQAVMQQKDIDILLRRMKITPPTNDDNITLF